ncbi:MAG: hypothetical protein AVDCRST_MAG25-1426 [uncultured Rubrobacteraceae bacterium]|uniref:Uncharacterized protein n=1 Tax=uncultured Rubrobacteraceae bacterium TaxID=349277 RepID=A0A6J4R630_9ACTN|nr:MAG: hypothetical protein AVDCRST_MAG25-1426 [uncultured Rubrobacteraceae bacterium]
MRNRGKRVLMIKNQFGEVGVDQDLSIGAGCRRGEFFAEPCPQ